MSGRWKRILALGAAVVLCLIAAAQMGSLFHWKVTCTPAAFAESSRRLSNPDRGFYYIYGYRITDEPVDYATDLRDRTREDDATRLGMMQINLREYRTGAISEEGLSNVRQLFAAMADSDNLTQFMQATAYVRFKPDTEERSTYLYRAYTKWCEDNLESPVPQKKFSQFLLKNAGKYGLTFSKHIEGKYRGFRGVCVHPAFAAA